MSSVVKVSYNGRWIVVPQNSYQALMYNWHKGVNIPKHSWFELDGEYARIYDWCRATFDVHQYTVFEDSVWFIKESDAMLCQLKWSHHEYN